MTKKCANCGSEDGTLLKEFDNEESYTWSELSEMTEVCASCGVVWTESKFNNENLVQFETDYFSVPSKFLNQRYGQAFINTFGEDVLYDKLAVFYSDDTELCRLIAWLSLQDKI